MVTKAKSTKQCHFHGEKKSEMRQRRPVIGCTQKISILFFLLNVAAVRAASAFGIASATTRSSINKP